jgi:DNA-binding protein H-NS
MKSSELLAALKELPLGELDRVIAAAEEERQAKRGMAKKALLDELRAKAEGMGLTLETLLEEALQDRPTQGKARTPARVKYRDPESGESWSGRGSAPGWLKRLEAKGRRRDEFAVES